MSDIGKRITEYLAVNQELAEIELHRDKLLARKESAKAQHITGMPSGTPDTTDQIGELLHEIQVADAEYFVKQQELIKAQMNVERIINTLTDPRLRTVMRKRFLEENELGIQKTIPEVAVEMGYSESTVSKLQSDAWQALNTISGNL